MDAREARGIMLLLYWLPPMQRAQFDASKYFDVVGCDSGTRYRITAPGLMTHECRLNNLSQLAQNSSSK